MEIRMFLGIYANLDYSVGTIRNGKEIRSTQARVTKFKTAKTALQVCTGFSGTVPEQRVASHFVFQCAKFACCWHKT